MPNSHVLPGDAICTISGANLFLTRPKDFKTIDELSSFTHNHVTLQEWTMCLVISCKKTPEKNMRLFFVVTSTMKFGWIYDFDVIPVFTKYEVSQ
jgi:hypothetical protein